MLKISHWAAMRIFVGEIDIYNADRSPIKNLSNFTDDVL